MQLEFGWRFIWNQNTNILYINTHIFEVYQMITNKYLTAFKVGFKRMTIFQTCNCVQCIVHTYHTRSKVLLSFVFIFHQILWFEVKYKKLFCKGKHLATVYCCTPRKPFFICLLISGCTGQCTRTDLFWMQIVNKVRWTTNCTFLTSRHLVRKKNSFTFGKFFWLVGC